MSNDNTILELKAQIAKKKELLKDSERFNPVTNCSLELHGTRYNLHVLGMYELQTLLIQLHLLDKASKELELEYTISGFSTTDWITDLKGRLNKLNRSSELLKLKTLENRLTQLLSNEKKVELEVAEIQELLKE